MSTKMPTTRVKKETESKKENEKRTLCPECGSDNLVEDSERGETVCQDCGLVVNEKKIDRGAEWRAFDSKERDEKARCGSPNSPLIIQTGTKIANSPEINVPLRRAKKYNGMTTKEQGLADGLNEIKRISAALGLSTEIGETAAQIYRKAADTEIVGAYRHETVAQASLVLGARQHRQHLSVDDVAAESDRGKNRMVRVLKKIQNELELEYQPLRITDHIGEIAYRVSPPDVDARELADKSRALLDDTPTRLKNGVQRGVAQAVVLAASEIWDIQINTQDFDYVIKRRRVHEKKRKIRKNTPHVKQETLTQY